MPKPAPEAPEPAPDAPETRTGGAAFHADAHGSFVPGVPARDLSAAEWDALPDDRRALALATGLYTPR